MIYPQLHGISKIRFNFNNNFSTFNKPNRSQDESMVFAQNNTVIITHPTWKFNSYNSQRINNYITLGNQNPIFLLLYE